MLKHITCGMHDDFIVIILIIIIGVDPISMCLHFDFLFGFH